MQQNNNYNLSDVITIKQQLNNLLNKPITVMANDGSIKKPRLTKFMGKLTIVTNNIFGIEQVINNTYKTTKTFMINSLLINKIKVEELHL